jgi:hypothetical protein
MLFFFSTASRSAQGAVKGTGSKATPVTGCGDVEDPTLCRSVFPNLGSASKSKGVRGIVYFH